MIGQFVLTVIPGRREAANPESRRGTRCGFGFRARAFGASRNDETKP